MIIILKINCSFAGYALKYSLIVYSIIESATVEEVSLIRIKNGTNKRKEIFNVW